MKAKKQSKVAKIVKIFQYVQITGRKSTANVAESKETTKSQEKTQLFNAKRASWVRIAKQRPAMPHSGVARKLKKYLQPQS